MKTGFAIFIIGLMLMFVSWISVDFDVVTIAILAAGAFLVYVGARLMKNRGSLVDSPTL
jgi:hypothetical protein